MNGWLRCEINPGQFSGEFAVSGRLFDGRGFSLFVPQHYVRGNASAGDGWVSAEIIEERNDLVLVRLPRDTLESGRFITVKKDQIDFDRERQTA